MGLNRSAETEGTSRGEARGAGLRPESALWARLSLPTGRKTEVPTQPWLKEDFIFLKLATQIGP